MATNLNAARKLDIEPVTAAPRPRPAEALPQDAPIPSGAHALQQLIEERWSGDSVEIQRVSSRKSIALIALTCTAAWGTLFAAAGLLYSTFQ